MAEYIEREALIKRLEVTPLFNPQYEYDELVRKGIIDLVKRQPDADVVEVRHGRWQEERWCDNFQHICALCHKTARVHPQSVAYKYCPYCGAKMDGKDRKE